MPFKPDPESFYTIEDLEKSGIAVSTTIRKWIKSGQLKARMIGRGYIIYGSDIRDFLLRGTEEKK